LTSALFSIDSLPIAPFFLAFLGDTQSFSQREGLIHLERRNPQECTGSARNLLNARPVYISTYIVKAQGYPTAIFAILAIAKL